MTSSSDRLSTAARLQPVSCSLYIQATYKTGMNINLRKQASAACKAPCGNPLPKLSNRHVNYFVRHNLWQSQRSCSVSVAFWMERVSGSSHVSGRQLHAGGFQRLLLLDAGKTARQEHKWHIEPGLLCSCCSQASYAAKP